MQRHKCLLTFLGCRSPLGMENKEIPDSAIKATTEIVSHFAHVLFCFQDNVTTCTDLSVILLLL